MDSAELIGMISAGTNQALLANVAADASWNVAADWGLGNDWQVVRVPVGLKFRHSTNGLVSEEVLIIRGPAGDRAAHEKLLSRSRVPAHLVLLERPGATPNRLAPHFRYPHVANEG